jgi:hypothetical protein
MFVKNAKINRGSYPSLELPDHAERNSTNLMPQSLETNSRQHFSCNRALRKNRILPRVFWAYLSNVRYCRNVPPNKKAEVSILFSVECRILWHIGVGLVTDAARSGTFFLVGEFCFLGTRSLHLQIFTSIDLYINRPLHLQIFTSTGLYIYRPLHLQAFTSTDLYIYRFLHLQIFTLQIFTSTELYIHKNWPRRS